MNIDLDNTMLNEFTLFFHNKKTAIGRTNGIHVIIHGQSINHSLLSILINGK